MNIENSFRETYHSSMLQTYLQTDEFLNLLLLGKTTGKTGLVEPLRIESAHIISCCLKLGSKSIDNYGRMVNEEFWTRCEFNDRKNANKSPDGSLVVEKTGVTFYFQVTNDMLFLKSITYRVDVLPKTLIEKSIPTHIFGELGKTDMGISIIEKNEVMKAFVNDILSPEAPLLHKRASLWAIGHIGSSETGLELILKSDIIPHIITVAENSDCLSLRGTSLYALGLISKTLGGKRVLSKFGWQSHSQLGAIVCLPKDITKFFTMNPIEFKGDWTLVEPSWKQFEETVKLFGLTEEKQKLVKLISNLSNHVTQKTALPELKKISQKSPELFMDEGLFHCIVMIMTSYNFKLQVRRYIFQLFDRLVMSPNFVVNYSKAIEGKIVENSASSQPTVPTVGTK